VKLHAMSEQKRILIVEDSPGMRQLVRLAIRPLKAEVVEAHDGLAALRCLAQQAFDVVVVDVNLPTFDGLKLVRRVRDGDKDGHRTRVVVITGDESAAMAEQAIALGADRFLRKPLEAATIERTLADLLGA
jgi:CheY-like chemotaxis protein